VLFKLKLAFSIAQNKTMINGYKECLFMSSKIDNQRIDTVWNSKEINSFIISMDNLLGEKCGYGESIEMLSTHEKVFYLNQIFEREVNNGGIAQFFYNSGDDFIANETLNSLREIGANKTAEMYKKVLDAFGCELPKLMIERSIFLDQIEHEISGEIDKFNNEFYKYQDDLNELNYQYIMKNKEQFEINGN